MVDPQKQIQQTQRIAITGGPTSGFQQTQFAANFVQPQQNTNQQNRSPSTNNTQPQQFVQLLNFNQQNPQNVTQGGGQYFQQHQSHRNNQFLQNQQNFPPNVEQFNQAQFQPIQFKQGQTPQMSNQKFSVLQNLQASTILHQQFQTTFSPRTQNLDQPLQIPTTTSKGLQLIHGRKSRVKNLQAAQPVDLDVPIQKIEEEKQQEQLIEQIQKGAINNQVQEVLAQTDEQKQEIKIIRTYKEMRRQLNQLQQDEQNDLNLVISTDNVTQQPGAKQQSTLQSQATVTHQNQNSQRPLSYQQMLKKDWQQLNQYVFQGNQQSQLNGNKQPGGQNQQQQQMFSNQVLQSNTSNQGTSVANATQMPPETLKLALQQSTSEILKKILARSDCMNQLRQIIDLRNKKVKQKNYDSQIFVQLIEREQQRIQHENIMIAKHVLKIDDRALIKYLQKMVKKMLKPFKGFNFDEFLHNEIHLNEIMIREDDIKDPIKESRKRHLRILDAALKEQVVDTQVVLCICLQISRQSFFNELQEYFNCAYEYVMANQKEFMPQDIQLMYQLKQRIQKMKPFVKVSIQQNKKLDKMFYLLLEQNQEVHKQIYTYKEKYEKNQEMQSAPVQNQQIQKTVRQNIFEQHYTSNQVSAPTSVQQTGITQQQQQQNRSNSNTGTTQQSIGVTSSNQLSSSRQSIKLSLLQQIAQKVSNRNNFSAQSQQTQQPRDSAQKSEQTGNSKRRIISRATNSQGIQEVFQSRDARQQDLHTKNDEATTPPRHLISSNQQRIRNLDLQQQSLVVGGDVQNRYQQKNKQLQPLVLNKLPKSVINTSSKVQALQQDDRYQQQQASQEQFNIINTKKKRNLRNKKFLEPLTEQKPVDQMNKTEQGFMQMSQSKFQQGKLLPIANVDQQHSKEEQEEFCQCTEPVAKKAFRQSAEFKMRIISKKKQALKNQHRLVCDNCGATIKHALHGSHSLTTVSKDKNKRSSYQIEAGQDDLDIPNFNINLNQVNIRLNFDQNQENEEETGFGGNTARLKNSSESSFSSRKLSSKSSDQVRNRTNRSSESSQEDDNIGVAIKIINQKYLKQLNPYIVVQNFIVKHRLCRIQRFIASRHQVKRQAAKLISKRVKIFLANRGEVQLRKLNINVQRRRAAINRIADLYLSLKVKKVAAHMVLNNKQLYDFLQQILTSDKAIIIIKSVVTLQRRWRAKYLQKFYKGRRILKNYIAKKQLWHNTLDKYRGSQNTECDLINQNTMFLREAKNLEQYFFRQQFLYLHDLDQRGQMIAFRTQRDFQQSDWTYNSNAREWTSTSGILKFALDKNDQPSFQVLRDKVIQFYITSQSPTIQFVSQHLQALTDSKNALQTLQERERQHIIDKIQSEIKRHRFEKLNL